MPPKTDNQGLLNKRRKLALLILSKLDRFYGVPKWRNPLPALDELISTILSQNTNDRNRDIAFINLRALLPTWELVRDAPSGKVIEAIRPAGLANQKGPRIQEVLRAITLERGHLDLEFLKEWNTGQARDWLQRFKGVGPKTAAIVLCFSLGKPAFPVDTHIYRVTGRLNLRDKNLNVDKTHIYLESVFPEVYFYSAHLHLIQLGREICHSRKPACPVCPLNLICQFYLEGEPSSIK